MQMQRQLKNRKNQKGFTLIEIMIVLAIVGMLFSFVGVSVIKKLKEAKVSTAKIQIASFQQGLQSYYLAHNNYPNTAQGLQALVSKPTVGKIPDNYPDGGHLSKKEVPKDPWGNPYNYECEDYQNFTITSNGPDGDPGTEDDIKSE